MKNLFIACFFLFFIAEKSYSQSRLHLADSKAVWHMLYINPDPTYGVTYYYYSNTYISNSDTLIDGNRMSILYDTSLHRDGVPVTVLGFLGEDSLHRVIMIITNTDYCKFSSFGYYDSLYNKPLIMADFSKSNGDSFYVYGNLKAYSVSTAHQPMRIDSILKQDILYRDSNTARGCFFANIYHSCRNTFYERVGDINEGIMAPFFKIFETFPHLLCYTENGVEFAPDSCNYSLNINERDLTEQLISTEIMYRKNYVIIDFNSAINIDHANINIYDINGRMVNQTAYEPVFNTCFVPTNNYANGIYILEISIPGTTYTIRKKIAVF